MNKTGTFCYSLCFLMLIFEFLTLKNIKVPSFKVIAPLELKYEDFLFDVYRIKSRGALKI